MAARCIYGEKSFGACDSATGGLGIGKSEADIKKNKRNKEEKRTMKKLTVLLAAVMAFAFSATAYAATPSDLADQPVKVQDAFAKTMALGIINGYEDGTAGPTQNITRAEFAKIAVTAAGAKDTADMLANNASSFKDIKAGQWYTGWINAAESLGIFQGDGNGNFRPNDTITNQEVITVLMRLLGYNDNLNGTWPVNYVTQANKVEILDDVAVVAAAPATRADVVVMLDATLDAKLVTYDKDTNEFVNKQTTKGGNNSAEISLLADSFKGTYVEVGSDGFAKVDQIRDAAKQTLNWSVVDTDSDDWNFIIDSDTTVSYNGGTLFDLEGHSGKVYYVKDSDKLYARFIEVESYTKTTTDKPTIEKNKVKVNKTTYNKVNSLTDLNGLGDKNSNYVMYFNDDDQVYAVKSDREYTEETGYVKSINSSTMKLVGTLSKSVSLDDVLVYTEDGFIAAADLKVGDAVMEIASDLYVKVDETTGTLTKTSGKKYTIGGKSYVAEKVAETNYTFGGAKLLDKDFDSADAVIDDVYGNEVSYILNKDNTISAVIVDETSTGTKLYGIVVGGDNNQNGFGNDKSATAVSIFTAEGKTVSYEYDSDVKDSEKMAETDLGQLVEYKLNKDGEIKEIETVEAAAEADDVTSSINKVEVDDNAYLDIAGEALTLASNVVIFEVDQDGTDIDPAVVTRSSVLAGGDFTPDGLGDANVEAYISYVLNSNGAIKAMAYTTGGSSNYQYGVADGDEFTTSDYDRAILFDGTEEEVELTKASETFKNHNLVVYTKSGSKVEVVYVLAHKAKNGTEVAGYTDGLISFGTDEDGEKLYAETFKLVGSAVDDTVFGGSTTGINSVKTDSETIVYVMNSSTGYYELGDLSSIDKGDYVQVLVTDDEGYADVVIVDEYNNYNAD